jgi:hypothetical protein
MTPMSGAPRWLRVLGAAVLVAGCAGPVPSTSAPPASPEATIAGVASPSARPDATATPTFPNAPSPAPIETAQADPTPRPLPDGALPPRTQVEVNRDIRDRPGVPRDMDDMYWWTEDGDAGQIGTTAQIGLPDGETVLTAAHGFVVSARVRSTGFRCDGGCTLIVRDIRTGDTVRRIQTDLSEPVALILPGRIFWAGIEAQSDFNSNVIFDGGVWTAALDGGELVAIVPPGQDISRFNHAGRLPFRVSPSSRTIASGVGGFADRFVDVIDVTTLSRRERLPNISAYALTDELVVTGEDPPSDYPSGGILAIHIATGDVRWRFPSRADVDQFELTNVQALAGALYVDYLWRKGSDELRLAEINASTGMARVLLRQTLARDTRALDSLLGISTERHVAFGANGSLGHLVQRGEASISILDVATGLLSENAFIVDPAFMCFPRYCRRY